MNDQLIITSFVATLLNYNSDSNVAFFSVGCCFLLSFAKWSGKKQIIRLKNDLHHYSYRTAEDHARKGKRYAELGAKHLIDKNKNVFILKQLLAPAFRFFKMYVLKLGFLDKQAGFLLALREARMVAWRYAYYRSLKKKVK